MFGRAGMFGGGARVAAAALVTAALCGAGAGAAQADTTSAASCDSQTLVQPFAALGDQRYYVPVPSGDFGERAGASWQLGGGSKLVGESDPLLGLDRNDSGSLSLPAGAAAVSPAMCVDLHYPTLRLALKPKASAGLRIEVSYPDAADPAFKQAATLSSATLKQEWQLSDDVPISPELGGSDPGARRVALRLTALGDPKSDSLRIDDLYVDPYRL
jgi:hypothetical protein